MAKRLKKISECKHRAPKKKEEMCDICGENPVVQGVYLWYTLDDMAYPEFDQSPCKECLNVMTDRFLRACVEEDLERDLLDLERRMRRNGLLEEE